LEEHPEPVAVHEEPPVEDALAEELPADELDGVELEAGVSEDAPAGVFVPALAGEQWTAPEEPLAAETQSEAEPDAEEKPEP
jgi:hypothetical protein